VLINPKDSQIKEVYARFGLAMYQVQCFERTLAILLATVYGPNPQKITRPQYEKLFGLYFQKTLGNLISQIRESITISQELEIALSKALKKRNWLTHHYFWERAAAFMKKEGRESMIEELREIADFFEDIDSKLTAIVEEWGRKQGITEQIIQRKMRELKNNE